jgi:hypothetical protein
MNKQGNDAVRADGRSHLHDEIHFHAPGLKHYETDEFVQRNRLEFVAISLTGASCALHCEHCQGRLLESMYSVPGNDGLYALCERLAANGTRGVLVSGGSDGQGKVPHAAFAADLRRVKERLGLTILVHTGLVDRRMAEALAAAGVDGAMIDVIGSDETIRRVYHLDASVGDIERSLALLQDYGIPSLPHIVMGLHYGAFLGEDAALEVVAGHEIAGLILVALTPLVGTPMQDIAPPALAEMTAFVEKARLRLPATPILLGCARPAGEAKGTLDQAAIDIGLNGIAFPAEGTVAYARRKGLRVRFHETCCGIPWLLGNGG